MDEYEDEEEFTDKRFFCDACGHNFCMEVEEDMPTPKFCIFCGSPVHARNEEFDEDEDE
tara:strand:+ start:131 stop:307 length:177 start_codon:yes stop_codon:yes gene_type:complete